MNSQWVSKVRAGVTAAVLATAIFASASYAHAQESTRVRVNVPFSFEDGNKHFRAGLYTVGLSDDDHMLKIQGNSDAGFLLIIPAETQTSTTDGKVVFRRYGDRYFLKEVWIPGTSTHVECRKSRAERHVALAQNDAPASSVELALLESPR